MSTIITRFIDPLLSEPSTTVGILWSLGLHATAFAALTWLSSLTAPPAPSDIVFAGYRNVVQIEATFSETSTGREIETMFELESIPLREDWSPAELPPMERELAADLPYLRSPFSSLQDDEAKETLEVRRSREANPPNAPHKIRPVETPIPEAVAALKQFAGLEDRMPPDLSGNLPPSYPTEAIRRQLDGIVLLRVYITVSGQVDRVEIARSSGHAILDRAASKAVSKWRGSPSRQSGHPVATVELLPIHFRL